MLFFSFFFSIFLFFHFTLSLFFPPSSFFSFFFFFFLNFRLSVGHAYRSVPVHGNPSSRKYTRGMQDWLGNGLDMFIDILKCRSPVFGCIVSYREGREREREREGEGARYTATINYTVTLDVGLFRGYRWRGLILGRMCSFGKN